jgi:hypothetical protein
MNKAELIQLGFDMQQWNVGGDPVYAAGSYLGAGLVPDLAVCKAARTILEACAPDNQAAANELAKVISRLDRYIAGRENLTARQMEDLVAHLAQFPRLAQHLTTLSVGEAKAIAKGLEDISMNAGAAAEYIGVLYGTDGTGRHSHADAANYANRTLREVRKVFGYSLTLVNAYDPTEMV